MNANQLFRLGGGAAIAAGALRIAAAFPLPLDAVSLEWLYAAIDALLIFAITAIYLDRAPRLRILGFASFAVAIAALSFIGGPDADPFGFSTYEDGATTLAIAMAGMSIAWLSARETPLAPPLCWFGSIIAAGVLGFVPSLAQYSFMAAGILFGAGFVAAGLPLVQRAL